jgi:hypothetical protein
MIFLFLPLFLFAKVLIDFSPCYAKYSFIKDYVPVTPTKSVTFKKVKNFLYFDPFTKMYVIESNNSKVINFSHNPKLGWWMAGIKNQAIYGGTYAKEMILFNLAKLSIKTPKNSVISDLFCRAYGISNGNGFITSEYITHFAKYGYWGDIGIYVDENMKVKYVDPYYVKGVKRGDKILKINRLPADINLYKEVVLFGKEGDDVYITTKNTTIGVKVRRRSYYFTPLLRFGIVVDKSLTILSLPKWLIKKTFITPPAKLIAVNGKRVKSFEELRDIKSKNVTITLQKDGISISVELKDGDY